MGGRDSQGFGDGHVHIFKIDNQQGPTVLTQGSLLKSHGSLDGRGAWERTDMYMYTCIPFLSTWNYHNIVHRLQSNVKQKVFLKKVKLLTACLPQRQCVISMNQEPSLELAVGPSAQNIQALSCCSLMPSFGFTL